MTKTTAVDDPMQILGTCEDPRLKENGYLVCGSNGDREWHWQGPDRAWRDHYRTEYAAVKAALRDLQIAQRAAASSSPIS